MVPPPPAAAASHDPLRPTDYAQIARATVSLGSARRAERVATASGWCLILGGSSTVLFNLHSGIMLALGIILTGLGARELALRQEIRRLQVPVFGRLVRNQIALGLTIAGYAAVRLLDAPPVLSGQLSGELASSPEMAALADGIGRMAHRALYAGLILGAILFQGLHAAYYARAGRRLARAHARTSPWIMRVHAAAWSGQTPQETPCSVSPERPAAAA